MKHSLKPLIPSILHITFCNLYTTLIPLENP